MPQWQHVEDCSDQWIPTIPTQKQCRKFFAEEAEESGAMARGPRSRYPIPVWGHVTRNDLSLIILRIVPSGIPKPHLAVATAIGNPGLCLNYHAPKALKD